MAAATTERLIGLLEPAVSPLGLDLDAVELMSAGRRRVLRVVVDRAGGVSLDQIADATRAVSVALDRSDPLGEQPYTLEVTSRGVDRPLTLLRHWQRNTGRLVAAQLADGSSVTGRIAAVDESGIDLDVDGMARRVLHCEVAQAHVQVEFTRREG